MAEVILLQLKSRRQDPDISKRIKTIKHLGNAIQHEMTMDATYDLSVLGQLDTMESLIEETRLAIRLKHKEAIEDLTKEEDDEVTSIDR